MIFLKRFVPPSTTSVLQRRVIQSIHLLVQRKYIEIYVKTSINFSFYRKKLFEKFVDQLKDKSIEPTMYQLGLEFLRLYDGKFNYPQGYTVHLFLVLHLKKKFSSNLVCYIFRKKNLVFNNQ